MRRAGGRLFSSLCLLGIVLIPSAQAVPGVLDPGFGAGGKVTTAIGPSDEIARSVAIQPDGKIVAAGYSNNGTDYDFALVRYNPNGTLDSSFGSGGKVTTPIGAGYDLAGAVALQPDGKIVAAGESHNGSDYDFALVRYKADGTLDATFDTDGKVTTPIGSGDDGAEDVVVQPDGKIVAAGGSGLARYNPDGSLDSGFGSGGKVTTGSPGAHAVALQPDGKIVAGGGTIGFALARYNPDGSLDPSFGTGGTVTTVIGSSGSANAVALQPDGKIVAGGYSLVVGEGYDFALARYNPNGTLDSSFNGTGKVTTFIGSAYDYAEALALQPDGKIVAGGYSRVFDTAYEFALARYNPDGSLDSGFGSGGKLTTNIGSGDDEAFAVALQRDGKIVAAGYSLGGSSYDFALARYLGSRLTVTKAGSGSGTVTTSPAGINCGSTCSSPFAAAPVTLTAKPAAGSSLTGWLGDCSGTGTCSLTMSTDRSATAVFERDKTLTVKKAGLGFGTVTSTPAGVSCGSTCSHAYAHGTSVRLTASASSRSKFAGWSGDCSGRGSCTLTMRVNRAATATFKMLCIVPKVKGKKLAAAKTAIKRSHCSVGKVTKVFSARVKAGRVVSQRPSPRKKLAPSSRVNLKVSRGTRR